MKYNTLIVAVLAFCLMSCNEDEDLVLEGNFKFVSEYSAMVTVGGFVGVIERTFEVGEVYEGSDTGEESINIRIAEHSMRNEDCPNSWCYQEFLEVPREFLELN